MGAIDGDLNRLNPNVILKTYESTLRENEIIEKKSKDLEEQNDELVKKLFEKETKDQAYKNNVYSMYYNYEQIIMKVFDIIEKGIQLVFFALLCFIYYKYSDMDNPSKIVKFILSAVGIYSLISIFFPVAIFSLVNNIFEWFNSYLKIWVHNWMISCAEKKIKRIFKD